MLNLEPSKIKMIAFDIDGTVFSSEGIISDVYKESIQNFSEKFGKPISMPSHEKIMLQIGKPVKTIFQNLLPELPENDRDIISDSVLDFLCKRIENGEGYIYPNAKETIHELKKRNFLITAASNGRRKYVETILKRIDAIQFFDDIAILNYKDIQTKGDILIHYKQKYQLSGNQILMVGDRASDRDASVNADTPFAFCTFGHAVEGEILDYSVELKTLYDIVSIFS
ncbi:MAG: HAD hydrolase-like protein [Leptospiraceae bacterium]|nr:HAD family hydrolase [Leptospiraceae bacterium]MCK6380565.1 HAD hydrolase-like protein [Leptospiraceae bacterium]NUM40736.1 HAD family hydrolase [Leptospiraceae bacterium]